MSFLNCEARERLKNSQLIQAFSLIDWEAVKQSMGRLGRSGYGPNGYAPINLLKALILQAWYNLSDEGLEEALRVRLDFIDNHGIRKGSRSHDPLSISQLIDQSKPLGISSCDG